MPGKLGFDTVEEWQERLQQQHKQSTQPEIQTEIPKTHQADREDGTVLQSKTVPLQPNDEVRIEIVLQSEKKEDELQKETLSFKRQDAESWATTKPRASVANENRQLRWEQPNGSDDNSPQVVDADPISDILRLSGLEYYDERQRDGHIWIVGDSEARSAVSALYKLGIRAAFNPRGSEVTGYRPSWWAKI